MNDRRIRVLLVEDDQDFAHLVREFLDRNGNDSDRSDYEITVARFLNEALRLLSQRTFEVILIDLSLPDSFGLDTFREIRKANSRSALIVLSGNDDDRVAVQAMQEGAQDYITKERVDGYYLNRSIRYALERKQAEEEIRFQADLLDLVPSAVITTDLDGTITYWNNAAAQLYGWSSDEALGRNVVDLVPSLDAKSQALEIMERLRAGEKWSGEILVRKKDGGIFPAIVTDTPILDPNGKPAGIIGISTDITERKQYEERLEKLNVELEGRVARRTEELTQSNLALEHANRTKGEFLATMSHELRTPLNSILGLSETLLEQRRGALNDPQQESLRTIAASGRHLLDLINDVLDLSKIEAGKFDYYPQVIEVNTLCRSCLAFINEQALRKSIRLHYEEPRTVSRIYADPLRLKQALVNLLSNAVKFTPANGQVTLEVQADEEQDLVQFSVVDTGIGIAADDLRQLFQPFAQVENAFNRQFEGTGLGLALVHRLVDLHGGSVHVESEVGKGSRFTINIPWGREKVIGQETGERGVLEPFQTYSAKSSRDLTVLLAEDNPSNVLTVGEYLKNHGYQVVNAQDGLEAVQKAEDSNPDIILMDIQMPMMDGLEAIRHLRADPRFQSTPIIALTALAMPGDRELCLQAGANEYVSKPVSLRDLVRTIDSMAKE